MAAIITEIIPRQNFEIVGDKIGEILAVELANQKTLQSLPENQKIFRERITPVDKTEEVVVNVLFDSFNNSYNTQSDVQARTNYFIDIYASGKAKGLTPGDEVVALKMLKYVGLCRYILSSHKYITLGLAPGSIGGKTVESIQMYEQPNSQDTNYSRMCRINFSVRIMENQALWNGVLLAESLTGVKLELTDKGYQYKLIN